VRDKSTALAEPVRSGTRNRPEAAARHGQTRSLIIISSLVLHTPPWFVFFRRRVTRGCCPSLQSPSPLSRSRAVAATEPSVTERVLVKTLPVPGRIGHPAPASSDLGNPLTGQTQRAGPCTPPPCLFPSRWKSLELTSRRAGPVPTLIANARSYRRYSSPVVVCSASQISNTVPLDGWLLTQGRLPFYLDVRYPPYLQQPRIGSQWIVGYAVLKLIRGHFAPSMDA
jgi:hypothetical protein